MGTHRRGGLCAPAAAGGVVALGSAGAGAAASAGSAMRPVHPVIAYIVNTGANTVVPLDTATNTLSATITVGLGPDAIAFAPHGKTAYIANGALGSMQSADTVTTIDTATNTVGKTIKVGTRPSGMAITPDGKTVYVVSQSGVTPVNTATRTAGRTIKVGKYPGPIAITPNGKTAYVLNASSNPVPLPSRRTGKPFTLSTSDSDISRAR